MPPSQLRKTFATYPRQQKLALVQREIGRIGRTLFSMIQGVKPTRHAEPQGGHGPYRPTTFSARTDDRVFHGGSDHLYGQRAQAIDGDLHHIAFLDRPHTRGRT